MPRSKQDFAAQSEERLNTILNAALTKFALDGYDNVSIDDITHEAKCSHGLFYHYFSSKEDLFHSLMQKIIEDWHSYCSDINFEDKPVFVLRDLTDHYLSYINGSDKHAYILYLLLTHRLKSSSPPRPSKCNKKKKTSWHIVIELIVKGQEEGVFENEDPEEMCRAYFACLEGLAYNRICLKNKYKPVSPNVLVNMVLKKGDNNV